MKSAISSSVVGAIIGKSGVITATVPSLNHPIAVKFFYRHNSDGSIRWIWPAGGQQLANTTILNMQSVGNKWFHRAQGLFFTLGLPAFFSHGKLVLYADVPTATFLTTHPWMNSI
jgi:hypothetical protein